MYIDSYRNILTQLCLQNKVKSLYAFGSVLTNRFNSDSDIDMVVDIDSTNPLEYADNYFNLNICALWCNAANSIKKLKSKKNEITKVSVGVER